jgi:tetratricopeptide (TPR) repeat protein
VLNGRDVLNDPALAQFRRYLPVLVIIGAPYAGLGGEQDPVNPLDPVVEWLTMGTLLKEVSQRPPENAIPLALARLAPPTAARLGDVLAAGGADAFRVVHFVCHGESDMLSLEDDDGEEAYAVTEQIVRLFKTSGVQVVVFEGCFSRPMAEALIKHTTVKAVIGTRRRVSAEIGHRFNVQFYRALSGGAHIRSAYRAAVREIKEKAGGQADRFELVIDEEQDEVTLKLPRPTESGPRPLIVPTIPRTLDVPALAGFVGRRDLLRQIAADLPGQGVVVLHGPRGIGKTWLAAQWATRFGWRFPGGIGWLHCTAVTTAQDVVSLLGRLCEVSLGTPRDDLLAAIRQRPVLLVCDQADEITSSAELARITTLIQQITQRGGASVLVTLRRESDVHPPDDQPLTLDTVRGWLPPGGGRIHTIERFSPKEARTLAMRLAVEHDVDALDVDTIDDCLERTLNFPWLIGEGVRLIREFGIGPALNTLGELDRQVRDVIKPYLRSRVEWVSVQEERALRILVAAWNLPDALDERLMIALAGSGGSVQVETLIKHGLLVSDGGLIEILPDVRAWIKRRFPGLGSQREQRDQVDRAMMTYLAQHWPPDVVFPLSRADAARLNNTRALLLRQIRPHVGRDADVLARLLIASAPAFRAAGLAEEFLGYAQGIRELLPEGDTLGRLQIAMGEVAALLPSQTAESGWLFRSTQRFDHLERFTWVEAQRAFGRHLVRVNQVEAAEEALSDALKVLLQNRPVDVRMAAQLAHDWGNTLAALDQHHEAIKRLGSALASYTRLQDAAQIAVVQYDLSVPLMALDEFARAEDMLRQALIAADDRDDRALGVCVRLRLAELYHRLAGRELPGRDPGRDLFSAAVCLQDAALDLLSRLDTVDLAGVYLRLAQVGIQLKQVDEAGVQLERSRRLFQQAHSPAGLSDLYVTLAQMRLADGDALSAEQALFEALNQAAAVDDALRLSRAAGVLLHLHELRLRRVSYGSVDYVRDTLGRAWVAHGRLSELGLTDYAAVLETALRHHPAIG